MNSPIINNKALARQLRAERKRFLALMRNGDTVTLMTNTVIARWKEAALWDAMKTLPGPIPTGDGRWKFDPGGSWKLMDYDVSTWLKPFGRKLEDTRLILRDRGADAHLFWEKGRYVAVQEEYLEVFNPEAEFFYDYGRIQVRLPDGGDVIGLVAPLFAADIPRFVVPADEVKVPGGRNR